MRPGAIAVIAAIALTLSSCAPKRAAVQAGVEPPPLMREEALVLPELPQEPVQDKEIIRKAPAAEPVILESKGERQYILLNFENTEIRTIIDTFSELLGINYILTPGISGTVTIQSYNKFPMNDLYSVFQSILGINGLTAIREGEFYRIVPIDTARQQALDVQEGRELKLRLDSSFVTQLIPLQYVKASEVANIFRNLMPRGTDLIVYEPTNMLIVTALPPTLLKFMKIIDALDVPESESESIRAFVYHVENGEAKKLAEILKTIYPPSSGTRKKTAAAPTVRRTTVPRVPATIRTTAAEALPGEIGDLTVTAYDDINALILKCTPKTFVALLDVLKKIDIPVKQVLIEVLIAEITLTDTTNFGLQWLVASGDLKTGFTTTSDTAEPTLGPLDEPLFATIVSGTIDKTLINSFLTAIAAESKLNVLANPQILALDNKEAEIKIGDEVPTATGLTQQPATGGGTTLVTSGQIEYRTVGTILRVTPHITEKGNVSMKLEVESSLIGEDVTLGSGTFPSFSTRKATTSAVVSSGRTLFLGGLISDSTNKTRTGIPILSKIPVLGYLFGTTANTVKKRELLVMVTPHVVGNEKEAREMTRDFQNRVKIINKHYGNLEKFYPPLKEEAPAEEEAPGGAAPDAAQQ